MKGYSRCNGYDGSDEQNLRQRVYGLDCEVCDESEYRRSLDVLESGEHQHEPKQEHSRVVRQKMLPSGDGDAGDESTRIDPGTDEESKG